MTDASVVQLDSGAVRGYRADGVSVFRGIPYASPPVGELRYAAPEPVESWPGVRDATENGPTPLRSAPNAYGKLPEHTVAGDDVLNLNVFTANLNSVDPQPVLVWIHGGAYHEGSAADPLWNLGDFARDGIVGVAINYRVGFDGYGYVPGATQNRGVLDWIAALEWVQRNIAAFGGDPVRVTISGHSSGASAVLRLLTLNGTHGLFARAIAQSPAELDITAHDAEAITTDLAAHLAVSADHSGFESLSVDAIQEVQYRQLGSTAGGVAAWVVAAGLGTTLRYMPAIDGDLITASMIDASRAGVGAHIPLLIGSAANELDVFEAFRAEPDERGAPAVLAEAIGAHASDDYLGRLPAGMTGSQQVTQFVSDRIFRRVATRFADSRPTGSTCIYEFAYPDAERGTERVFHGDELPYLFGAPAARDQSISARIRADWVAFVSEGNPGWATYDDAAIGRRYGVTDEDATLYDRERALFLRE